MELAVPVWVMLAVGAVAALIAIIQGDSLAEGIVLSAILGLVLWFALSLPLPVWVRQLALSGGIGLISGLIAAGVYSDFFASPTAGRTEPSGRTQPTDDTPSNRTGDAATSAPLPDATPQVPNDGPAPAERPTKFAE